MREKGKREALVACVVAILAALALLHCGPDEPIAPAAREASLGEPPSLGFVAQRSFMAADGSVTCLATHPRIPRVAVGGEDGTIKVIDLQRGEVVTMGGAHEEWVTEVAWSPGGRYLATGSADNTVRIWDVSTGGLVRILEGHRGDVKAVAFSGDGKRIASGGVDRRVIIWDAVDGSRLASYSGYGSSIYALAFHPEDPDLLLIGGRGRGELQLWDVANRSLVDRLDEHRDSIFALALARDALVLVSAGADGRVLIWDSEWNPTELGRSDRMIDAVAVSPDGKRVATGDRGGEITLWDREAGAGAQPRFAQTDESRVVGLGFTPDGSRLMAATEGGGLARFDGRDLEPLELGFGFGGFAATVRAVTLDAAGAVVAGLGVRGATVWSAETGDVIATIDAGGEPFESLALSPDGSELAAGKSGGRVGVYDLPAGELARTLDAGQWQAITALSWSPDGRRLLVGGGWGMVAVLDAETGGKGPDFLGHDRRVTAISANAAGTVLLSSSEDKYSRVWDMETGKNEAYVLGRPQMASAISDDGGLFATGDDKGLVKVLTMDTAAPEAELKGHSRGILGLAWVGEGREVLVSAGRDRTLKAWSVPHRAIVTSVVPHPGGLAGLAASKGGALLATCGAGSPGNVTLWKLAEGSTATKPDAAGAAAAHAGEGLPVPEIDALPADPELERQKSRAELAGELLAEIRAKREAGEATEACDAAPRLAELVDNIDPYREEVAALCVEAAAAHETPEQRGDCVRLIGVARDFAPTDQALEQKMKRCELLRVDELLAEQAERYAGAPAIEQELRHYEWRALIEAGEKIAALVKRWDAETALEGTRAKLARGRAYLAYASYQLAWYEGEDRDALIAQGSREMKEAARLAPADAVVDELEWALAKDRYGPLMLYGGGIALVVLALVVLLLVYRRRQAKRMAEFEVD